MISSAGKWKMKETADNLFSNRFCHVPHPKQRIHPHWYGDENQYDKATRLTPSPVRIIARGYARIRQIIKIDKGITSACKCL